MNRTSPSRTPHHFLFMLPGSTSPEEQEQIVKTAKELTSMGYIYVASAREKTMEDRDNIRFMPLREGQLPCFGSVTGVMVVRDQSIARAAEEAYPGAKIFVIDPAHDIPEAPVEEPQQSRRRANLTWPQPLMQAAAA
jgi:hypothetical protein